MRSVGKGHFSMKSYLATLDELHIFAPWLLCAKLTALLSAEEARVGECPSIR